jgi:hypothetical protein
MRSLRARDHAAIGLLGLALLATACGGSPKSPNVAAIGTTSTTSSGSAGSGSPASGGLPKNFMASLLSYSECMRSHGIADFPDPTPGPNGQGGGFQIRAGSGSDLNPNNPTYAAANTACQHLLPYGGATPQLTPAQLQGEERLAKCVRAHGYPSFPDPNGKGAFDISGIDIGSAQFQSVMHSCRSSAKFTGPMIVNASNAGPPPSGQP